MGLKDYVDAVLTNIGTVWATAGVDLPTLQYVAEGPFSSVAFDCEQVVVSVDVVTRGHPGEPVAGYQQLGLEWSATVTAIIARMCMATSEDESPPAAADHAAAAAVTMRDLDLLWRNTKAIFDVSGCRHHGVIAAQLVEVQGALGGARITVHVDLLDI